MADVIMHREVLDGGVFFVAKPISVKALAFKVGESLQADGMET